MVSPTRKVDDRVRALGVDGISKSEVSRICGELDTAVTAFRSRAITGEHRYVWLDATYHKVPAQRFTGMPARVGSWKPGAGSRTGSHTCLPC